MKKLTLHLDELHVESFELSPASRGEGGTVMAHASSDLRCWTTNDGFVTVSPSCFETCGYSCEGTCDWTCGETCIGNTCACWP
jgi:hypothetical protein